MQATALQGIYGILPADLTTEVLLAKAESALQGGLRILQFRDKKSGYKRGLKRAKLLRDLTQKYDATLIINDSLQMAQACHADGVHLGRGDISDLGSMRSQANDDFIIGITCHADARYAKSALEHGANYVSFGAVFASSSKPDVAVIGLPRLAKACTMFSEAHICAIGGIDHSNIMAIRSTGASCAAMISALFAGDSTQIQNNTRALIQAWNSNPTA